MAGWGDMPPQMRQYSRLLDTSKQQLGQRPMISLVVVLAVSGSLAVTSTATHDAIQEIDAACAHVSELSQNGGPAQIFADFADASDRNAADDWRAVADKATLEHLAETTYPYTQAFTWGDQHATLVRMFFTSPSGDWALFVDYCFDKTGALVRSEGTLNTFNEIDPDGTNVGAGISRIKTAHYAQSGQVLRSETRLLDLQTKEPAPRRQFMDRDDFVFTTISALPFWGLMTK